jgi:hypothetical protein
MMLENCVRFNDHDDDVDRVQEKACARFNDHDDNVDRVLDNNQFVMTTSTPALTSLTTTSTVFATTTGP